MTTIQRIITVDSGHQVNLTLTLPEDFPEGTTEVVINIYPDKKDSSKKTILDYAGCLANSPAFSRDPVELQREWRDEWE